MDIPLLNIAHVTKFYSKHDTLPAVDNISFSIYKNRSVALIGESGCGKSTVAKLITGLEKPTTGEIQFQGKNIVSMQESQLRPLRKNIQLIFQCSKSVFNPNYTVGDSIKEVLCSHEHLSVQECTKRIDEIFDVVQIPKSLQNKYVSQLSGGQCQRANIARSLILKPELLICDEPLASLDYSIRHQILELLQEIKAHTDVTYLLITHDLSNVKDLCEEVVIMYKGNVVEHMPVQDNLEAMVKHPYSYDLFRSIPSPDPHHRSFIYEALRNYESTESITEGCIYKNRCAYANKNKMCGVEKPALKEIEPMHYVACHKC